MWYALHAFIHDFIAIDVYMGHKFNEFLEQCKDEFEEYFFIRYWLGGPHVRLRFKLRDPVIRDSICSGLQDSVDAFLREYGDRLKLVDRDNYYQPHMLKAEKINSVYWCEHGKVVDFTYEPEFDRYGGESNMYLSERIFSESSHLVCQLNTLPFPKRIVAAFDLMMLTFLEAGITDEGYKTYCEIWSIYVQDDRKLGPIIDFLRSRYGTITTGKDNFMALYGAYLDILATCFSKIKIEQEKKYSILASHVHMTNNRMGITPEYEYELAQMLYQIKKEYKVGEDFKNE